MAVSNTYTDLLPRLWGMVAATVRQNSIMPRLVANFSDNIAGTPGSTIQIPDQVTGYTRAVTHDISAVDPTNLSLTTTALALNNWREAPFVIDDKMAAEVVEGTVPRVLRAYAVALAEYIDAQIMAVYTGVYNTGQSERPSSPIPPRCRSPLTHDNRPASAVRKRATCWISGAPRAVIGGSCSRLTIPGRRRFSVSS
jgi:hypothetical protein